jgi:hypothetical protein
MIILTTNEVTNLLETARFFFEKLVVEMVKKSTSFIALTVHYRVEKSVS